MKARHALGILMLVAGIFSEPPQAFSLAQSGIADQVGVEVTVYNNDLGLIKDLRRLELPTGEGTLRFMDVASRIMPETVRVRSVDAPGTFAVLEQNYEYDLMDAGKLLDKYVGEKIRIVTWNRQDGSREMVEATLLSNNQGQVYRIDEEIYLGHPGVKVLPKLPENLIAKPTLTWNYANRNPEPQQIEVSYLTRNIGWKADYVLVLDAEDSTGDLSGWVTLDNRSGTAYNNARLKLVAGDVHRVEEARPERRFAMKAMEAAETPQFEEKSFFEYHIYDLQRKTDIRDKQTKQVRLLTADGVRLEKELLVYGHRSWFSRKRPGQKAKQPVNVYIRFSNTKENRLGMPLPAGIMRLYKRDAENSLQFAGEDRLEHTPKDETVRLKTGEAFDLVAEKTQTDYRRVTPTQHESEWEITLRNHKETDATIGIVEPLYGNWRVVSNSHPYRKTDAFTVRFDVNVPANGSIEVRYRVRVGI